MRHDRCLRPLAAFLIVAGCGIPDLDLSEEAAAAAREQDLGTLPYHPVAYHLDLSILAYQLYGQTLAWPFDHYYEDAGPGRAALAERVREWAAQTGAAQVAADPGLEAFRGPGVLGGFEDNPAHDPIVYQYSRLHPWSDTLTYPSDRWTEYRTPRAITGPIAEVWMCARGTGASQLEVESGAEGSVARYPIPARRDDAEPGARDVLIAFEGGTGDKGEPGQPASQSLAGFALVRMTEGERYDVHIAFRGSRSGSAGRAVRQALSTGMAGGNPDWITDLGYREEVHPTVSAIPGHAVSRGMATAIESSLPTLFHCLDHVVGRARTQAPTHIYVTGHSLGGAQAQVFTSAVRLGDRYGPGGPQMPDSLRAWPWPQIKLVTFGAPRVGNLAWAQTLTTTHLESQFYFDQLAPFDAAATGVTEPELIPRLTDASRPAAYRVLLPSDPVTTDLIAGGAHVGHTVYLAVGDALNISSHTDFDAHEPLEERSHILETLRDPRIPEVAWAYREMEELNPDREEAEAGGVAEYQRLAQAVRDYYTRADLYFDREAFDASTEVFVALVGGE